MTKETINTPDILYAAELVTPWGCKTVELTKEEIPAFQRDPDGFAAAHFGLDRNEYQEWLECNGAAKCGAKTKSGNPCGNIISETQLESQEWKALHRSQYCSTHDRV